MCSATSSSRSPTPSGSTTASYRYEDDRIDHHKFIKIFFNSKTSREVDPAGARDGRPRGPSQPQPAPSERRQSVHLIALSL